MKKLWFLNLVYLILMLGFISYYLTVYRPEKNNDFCKLAAAKEVLTTQADFKRSFNSCLALQSPF